MKMPKPIAKIVLLLDKERRINEKLKEIHEKEDRISDMIEFMRSFRQRMSGEEYEVYCAMQLVMDGYKNIDLTPVSGDFGADIIAYYNEEKYCFQCKRYDQPVGIDAVQQIHSAKSYYGCDFAGVLTNNRFTPAALELADRL